MGNLNSDTNRVYTVMHKSLKCDADEAKQWIKDRSAKLTFAIANICFAIANLL